MGDLLPIEDEFVALLTELTQGIGEMVVCRDKQNTGSDVVCAVTPLSANAAAIDARLETDFGVYLLFGVADPFEVPLSGGRYEKKSCFDEVRLLCMAVIKGHFEEDLKLVNGKARSSKHRLVLDNGQIIKERWSGSGFLPALGGVRVHHKYSPWVRQENTLGA
jgi:hypothetical protein